MIRPDPIFTVADRQVVEQKKKASAPVDSDDELIVTAASKKKATATKTKKLVRSPALEHLS